MEEPRLVMHSGIFITASKAPQGLQTGEIPDCSAAKSRRERVRGGDLISRFPRLFFRTGNMRCKDSMAAIDERGGLYCVCMKRTGRI